MQVWKELVRDEIAEVVAGRGLVVVEFAMLVLGRGPAFPPIGLFKDVAVLPAFERGFVSLVLFQVVQVLQKEQPGSLLGVVELSAAQGSP